MDLNWLTFNKHDLNVSLTLLVSVFFTGFVNTKKSPALFFQIPTKTKEIAPSTQELHTKTEACDSPHIQLYWHSCKTNSARYLSFCMNCWRCDAEISLRCGQKWWTANNNTCAFSLKCWLKRLQSRTEKRWWASHHSVPVDARRVGDPLL